MIKLWDKPSEIRAFQESRFGHFPQAVCRLLPDDCKNASRSPQLWNPSVFPSKIFGHGSLTKWLEAFSG